MNQIALKFPGGETILEEDVGTGFNFAGTKPTDVINVILPFIFVIAGLILFVMFFFGGFTIFTSAGNAEKVKHGQGMIVNALIGFAVIFAAYWIIELLQYSLGFQAL